MRPEDETNDLAKEIKARNQFDQNISFESTSMNEIKLEIIEQDQLQTSPSLTGEERLEDPEPEYKNLQVYMEAESHGKTSNRTNLDYDDDDGGDTLEPVCSYEKTTLPYKVESTCAHLVAEGCKVGFPKQQLFREGATFHMLHINADCGTRSGAGGKRGPYCKFMEISCN